VDFFKDKILLFPQNKIISSVFWNFFLEKMSNLNDYEDKEVIIDDEKVADSNSNKKKAIIPWVLTFAYEFYDIKVLVKGNRVKCKACGNLGAFCINDRTTNHINHITQTAPLKHAIMRENIKLNRTPSTKEINAKRKLDEMFEATSKTFLECFLYSHSSGSGTHLATPTRVGVVQIGPRWVPLPLE
jgi:hypothetical protein